MAQIQLSLRVGPDIPRLTSADIRQEVVRMMAIVGASDVDPERVLAELEASFATVVGEQNLLHDRESWEPWLPKKKDSIEWRFSERYRHYLLSEEQWAEATLRKMDETTDQILGLLTDPSKEGRWDRRGMVVGDVQSGKTAHYIGLICKAADAGYKIIIVLAGFHNSLRSQTQIRLEEGFLGYDWGASSGGPETPVERVGVGLQDFSFRADTATTRANDGDFKRQAVRHHAISPGGVPRLFVVKKNGSVLKNLLGWVRGAAVTEGSESLVQEVPLLVIDDEADQGSVDTGLQEFDEEGNPDPEHDPKPINRHIRRLLHLFEQSAYVGYTATPFANIFIHERAATKDEGEDLFPRSFIISLPTPSSHIGPAKVFGYEAEDGHVEEGFGIVRSVADHAESLGPNERFGWMPSKHKKQHLPLFEGEDTVPPSLREALYAFLLACAARSSRGQDSLHNSMLVHVTRFTAVQERVAEQISAELKSLERRLRFGEGDDPNGALSQLRDLWETDFQPTSTRLASRGFGGSGPAESWAGVRGFLRSVVTSIKVRQINGMAGEVLDYVDHRASGLNVIAIGGDKLSRGLTLEGLTVSYFLRASKMYDTLMQMGRWFGYRDGYLDLCRLYTTEEMADWFSHIAKASDELREDFVRMDASGSTPRDFGQRVRSHPTLLVTSRVKMRHGQDIDLSYEGDISETINFWRDREHLERNLKAASDLILWIKGENGDPGPGRNDSSALLWEEVEAEPVVSFLRAYREHRASKRVKSNLLADYIEAEGKQDRLKSWSVLIASGEGRKEFLGGEEIPLVMRSWHPPASGDLDVLIAQNHYRIRRLLNPVDESADLLDYEYAEALRRTLADWEKDPRDRLDPSKERARPRGPSGIRIREVRPSKRGLLLIYPLDGMGDEKVEAVAEKVPVVGFGISFPFVTEGVSSKVSYRVNNVYYQQEVLGLSTEDDS
jgi:hypothetical protein